MKYSLLSFKYFIDVVETQGFTPAAKRNFVSQTAISNSIKNLEKELKVKLIDRSTSHFQVTLAGMSLYDYAVPLLKKYYEFGEKVSQLDNTYHTLRIHYLRGFGFWTIKLAQSLKTANKNIDIQLDTESFSDSIPKLDANDYDVLIGFSTAVSKIKNIHSQCIGTANFGIITNRQNLDNHGILKKKQIKKQPLFLQKWAATDDNDVQTKIRKILKKMKIEYSQVVYLDSFDAALANVILDHGMAIYPKEMEIPGEFASDMVYLPKLPLLQYDVVAIYRDPVIKEILAKKTQLE